MLNKLWCSQTRDLARMALASSVALAFVIADLLPAHSQSVTVAAPQQISNAKVNQTVNDESIQPVAAPNANVVAFTSFAGNLDIADADTNSAADVFLYNAATSPNLSRQSVTTNGEQTGNTLAEIPPASLSPSISPALPDGKYGIAFTSVAENLLTAEGYPVSTTNQVYLRLPFLNRTILLSRGISSDAGNGDSDCPSITAIPGSTPTFKVVFTSRAGNLKAPALPAVRETTAIYLATVTVNNSNAVNVSLLELFAKDNAEFSCPVISGDGRYVAFASTATDLLTDRTTAGSQMFRFDLTQIGTGRPVILSAIPGVEYGQGSSFSPSISYTGDKVVFTTQATNLDISASASAPKVVLYKDNVPGLTLVNKNAAGEASNALYFLQDAQPQGFISADGRVVAFVDKGTNLVTPATAVRMHVYVKSTASSSAAPVLVSKTDAGAEAAADCADPVLGASSFGSADAFVAFSTASANLGTPGGEAPLRRVFKSAVTVPNPPITQNYQIPVPPEVVVRNRQITLTFLRFSATAAAEFAAKESDRVTSLASKVSYTVTVRGVGNRTRITRTTNRNRITISRLNPGTYTASYKATRSSSGSRRSVSTKQSPQRKFKVQ